MEIHIKSWSIFNDMGSELQRQGESIASRNVSTWFYVCAWVVQIIMAFWKTIVGSSAEEVIFLWNVLPGWDA